MNRIGLNKLKRSILVLLITLIINNVQAEDSLSALMQRMKSDVAVKIAYQETRTLELFEQPWQGNGFMYSTTAGLMLREQLQPKRLLMAINKNRMYYLDPENHLRHQTEIEEDNPLILQIAVFQALINADEALLKRLYQVDFATKSQRWLMTLKSKQADNSDFSIVVSGFLSQKVDTIIIRQADGDSSEFLLQSNEGISGEQVNNTVNRLYSELQGE